MAAAYRSKAGEINNGVASAWRHRGGTISQQRASQHEQPGSGKRHQRMGSNGYRQWRISSVKQTSSGGSVIARSNLNMLSLRIIAGARYHITRRRIIATARSARTVTYHQQPRNTAALRASLAAYGSCSTRICCRNASASHRTRYGAA